MKCRAHRSWVRPVLGFCLSLVAGCRVPREVHEPIEYPQFRLQARAAEVHVVDARPRGVLPAVRPLMLPTDFAARASARLTRLLSDQGPALDVALDVAAADELEIVDARGEMTRVLVRLRVEVKVKDGPVLARAESQSSSDLPREEASPEEVAFVLDATALDAFDRYWGNAATLKALDRELAAYEQKHPSAVSP